MARKSRKQPIIETIPATIIYNAAAYVRLSADDRRKKGDSLETQRNIIENFVSLATDIRIVEVYEDNSKTGTNFDRPAFQKMLADAGNGKINCVICKDLSRFGRSSIDAGYYIEKYLPSLGVRFIAVTDDFDSNISDGGVMLALKNLLNESYALDIGRKCKAVQRQNINDGKFVGRMAPYGYKKAPNDCHKLIIDPQAATTVKQIFDWAASGIAISEITRKLNENGIDPPSHYKQKIGLLDHEKLIGTQYWERRTVVEILNDRVYVGDMVQGKTRKINHNQVNVPRSEWVIVEHTHEQVVDKSVFECVQQIRKNIAELIPERHRTSNKNIFAGKVKCAHCGLSMTRKRQKNGAYWFRCESQFRYVKSASSQGFLLRSTNEQQQSLQTIPNSKTFSANSKRAAQSSKACTKAL
ncbi:hypothetical protein FACS1894208_05670 [Clostridia bacterium]|nr:hypothetical protein FACS1894208_05670 [Clostridia bacterium]